MENQNLSIRSQLGSPTLRPDLPIKANDQKAVFQEIYMLLMRLAKIYQVPNWDNTNAELLTEWLTEEFKHYGTDLILETLRNPPKLNEQAWRLTPDTLREWIDLTRNKRVENQIKEESQKRQEINYTNEYTPRVHELVEKFKAQLAEGNKAVPAMTEKEIKEEGQHRPKQKSYVPPDIEYVKAWEEKIKAFQAMVRKDKGIE